MISLDTLRFLRKKKFWIALIGVLVIAVMIFVNLDKGESDEYRQMHAMAVENKSGERLWYFEDDDYVEQANALVAKLEKSIRDKEWHQINRYICDFYLMEADRIAFLAKHDDPSMYYHDYMKNKEIVSRMMEEHKLPKVDESMLPEDYQIISIRLDQVPQFPRYQFQARFYDELGKQDIDQLTYSTVDSSTVFIQFIRMMFPLLPIIIVAIMCYDALQEDKDSGVVNVLLTQPIERSFYIRKKIMINMKSVLFIFLVPLLVMSLSLGIFDHYKTIQAPVLANTDGITSIQLMENTLNEIQKHGGTVENLGITKYFSIPYQYGSPNVEFNFMKMWQFAALCILMAILVLIFFVLLNTFISVILRNKISALAVSLAIMLCGMFLAQPTNTSILYACLPFTYMNPVDILSGYSSYTWLTGMLVLTFCDLLLYGLIIQIYKRKDVFC